MRGRTFVVTILVVFAAVGVMSSVLAAVHSPTSDYWIDLYQDGSSVTCVAHMANGTSQNAELAIIGRLEHSPGTPGVINRYAYVAPNDFLEGSTSVAGSSGEFSCGVSFYVDSEYIGGVQQTLVIQ